MPVNSELPVSVRRPVVERAIANAPDARYQSVEEFVEAMDRAMGAKASHGSWETREEQAERLRDRLLSRPGGEDLINVVEWALTLDEASDEDMASLVRVLPWMDLASVRWLWEWDTSAFGDRKSEEHTSELQSLMRISYAVFCLKKKKTIRT